MPQYCRETPTESFPFFDDFLKSSYSSGPIPADWRTLRAWSGATATNPHIFA
ncbi:MAG TPA: hypothetical protein VJZ16_00115 [Syntrophales bacterium]|nr:hypothetical protein [Syntrophales bacterium]